MKQYNYIFKKKSMDFKMVIKELERIRCNKHKLRPITVPKGDNLALVCCCENFKRELVKIAVHVTTQQIKVDIIEDYVILN